MDYSTEFHISNEMKQVILKEFIEPNYKRNVQENIELIKYFRRFGLFFDSISKLFVGVGSVMSFSSGIYKSKSLSFVSGTISVISLVFLQYATFSFKESKKYTAELNNILRKLNIDIIPEQYDDTNYVLDNTPDRSFIINTVLSLEKMKQNKRI